jgi:phenylalanyl-tRNA synthetase beta chain
MKLSYNWLNSIIDTGLTAVQIDELLTKCGLEVEGIEPFESIKGGLKGLVIGLVIEKEKHPDADRLSVTKVDVGQDEPLTIVCGAPNVAKGQKVIIAPVGTMIHPMTGDSFEIKKAKIRGQLSEGMICADDEVGLGTSHEGIRVLPEDAPIGQALNVYLNIENDEVLEIGLTPNRGDAASVLGVARDLQALTTSIVKIPDYAVLKGEGHGPIQVNIVAIKDCPRYSGIYIKGVSPVVSPDWIQNRLKAIGIKPKNILIDATNYVLHELGQPIHAFDADKIEGNIIVRKATKGEKMVTLDDQTREFEGFELLICDDKKPLAIAGVFGGKHSGVSEATQNIFIESAYFDPASIRKTAKSFGLNTDASFRYERGTDPEITVYAMRRVAQLILEIAGGTVIGSEIDVYPTKAKNNDFKISPNNIRKLTGAPIEDAQMVDILEKLDIAVNQVSADAWQVSVPPRKHDVLREIDIVEEVLRIYGYDNVPFKKHLQIANTSAGQSYRHHLRQKIGNYLAANGYNEILTNPLSNVNLQNNQETTIALLNPLSSELGVLRDNMLSTALTAIAFNQNRKNTNIKFFEFGKIYANLNGESQEEERLIILVSGNKSDESWIAKSEPIGYYNLKSVVENIFTKMNRKIDWGKENKWVNIEKVPATWFKQIDIKGEIWYADIAWGKLTAFPLNKSFEVANIPKFPEVRRDLSLVIDKAIEYSQLEQISKKIIGKKLKNMNLFDVFEGKALGENKKSYAVSFILYDEEKTFTDKEIEATMDKLIAAFENDLGAIIRR